MERFILSVFCLCTNFMLYSCKKDSSVEMKLWYNHPAENWMRSALPIGNGELGAMFFGGVSNEQVQFNEKSLWTGNSEKRGAYQSFGDIFINFEGIDSTKVENYCRELSLDEAIGRVTFDLHGVTYEREYFASFPDSVIVIRLTTPENKGKLSLSVGLKDGREGVTSLLDNTTLLLQDSLDLISYEAQLKVLNEGGVLSSDGNRLNIKEADAVTLLLTGATNFSISSPDYIGETAKQLHNRISDRICLAYHKGYEQLKQEHLNDYCPLFSRVKFDLGVPTPDMPTDELVRLHKESLYLDMLYFQYGRYLMLASSRGMDLPNNLQGIWNNDNTPPWECDIHSNINVQMNYWPVENSNLSECHEPFLNYLFVEALRPEGSWRKLAESEGLRGWTVRTQNNIFGYTDWNINRPANAWYCMHLWQHYLYTQDVEFLSEKAFPVMKSACEYWFDRLKQDENGKLIAPDEWSPEQGPWEDGVAYAQQLIGQLFSETSQAAQILDKSGKIISPEFIEELSEKFGRLHNGIEIGSWGQIREWKIDSQNLDTLGNEHRHLSQLIALYPGNQISYYKTPEYAKAAKQTLLSRGDIGTGWSRAWKIACWARLLDGDHAYKLLKSALSLSTMTVVSMDNDKGGIYENLFDSHPPFQIDGNFGATAGITEMLIQSYQGFIQLLPALPSAWSEGYVNGLRAVGNFTFNLKWNENMLKECTLLSGSGNECIIFSPDIKIIGVNKISGEELPVNVVGENMYSFSTEKGESYQLILEY